MDWYAASHDEVKATDKVVYSWSRNTAIFCPHLSFKAIWSFHLPCDYGKCRSSSNALSRDVWWVQLSIGGSQPYLFDNLQHRSFHKVDGTTKALLPRQVEYHGPGHCDLIRHRLHHFKINGLVSHCNDTSRASFASCSNAETFQR